MATPESWPTLVPVLFALSVAVITRSGAATARTVRSDSATGIPSESIAFSTDERGFGELSQWIGPAAIVAFGEGSHLAREPLEFRNALFRYLVEYKGFTSIAIESGLLESR